MGRFDWERLVKAFPLPATVKLVALILATYADLNGRDVRPGEKELARSTGLGPRQIRRHLARLRDEGLIEPVAHGGSRLRYATMYRLTRPHDILDRLREDADGNPELRSPASSDRPVDNHRTEDTLDVLSSDRNSGHGRPELRTSGTELRTSEARTEDTQMSSHHKTNQTTNHEHPSLNPRDDRYETHRASPRRDDDSPDSASQPLPGTPAALAVELAATEAERVAYAEAYQILTTLPDLGAFLVERAAREHADAGLAPPSQTRLVIRAAEIWRENAERRPA